MAREEIKVQVLARAIEFWNNFVVSSAYELPRLTDIVECSKLVLSFRRNARPARPRGDLPARLRVEACFSA